MKKEKYEIKLTLPAKKARPAPPVTTALGPSGINIHKFCEDFNEWSKDLEGKVEFGVIIYDDLSYDILTKKEMINRELTGIATLLSTSPGVFKPLYDSIEISTKKDNLEKEINPISTIRQKLEELYALYNDGKVSGMIIPIEDLNCVIYKGKELHFDQNQIYYSDNEGIINIDGTENELVSKSYVKLNEKEEVRFDSISQNSEELQFLNNVIQKINTVLQKNKKQR